MPNPIKYSTGSESDALKKGNLYIGTGAVGKGPSDTTGYYQGPSVPSNGYVIYMNKVGAPGGLSYHSAANDSELISFTNSLDEESFTTTQQCFDYYYGQTDKVLVNQDYSADYPYIVMDDLVLNLDAGISQSYPGSGTVWTDINGLGPKNNGTLINGPTFSTDNGGVFVFDGVNDYTSLPPLTAGKSEVTVAMYVYPTVTNSTYHIYTEGGVPGSFPEWWEFSITTQAWYTRDASTGPTGGRNNDISTNFLTLNTWNYITAVYSVSGGFKRFYVNGVLRSSSTTSIDTLTTERNPNNAFIARPTDGRYFNGKVAGCLVYYKSLTTEEVLQNFNATKGRFGL